MSDSIREQIAAIDKGRAATLELVVRTVQPLAKAAYRLLKAAGTDVGRFRKHKEFHSGKILVRGTGKRWREEIEVHYDNQLVLHFDDFLPFLSHMDGADRRQYLFFFRGGEWEQVIVEEYRKLSSMSLRQNFDVSGESCDWFDHNLGACSRYESRVCPCEDYTEEK